MFDSDIVNDYYKKKCFEVRHLFELIGKDKEARTGLRTELQTFCAYQSAVVDLEMYSFSLTGTHDLKPSERFIMTRKIEARGKAHDCCIQACNNINSLCERYDVSLVCDFNTEDRHKVARFAGEMVRALYIEGILPGLRTLSENKLSEEEMSEVIKAAESLDIPKTVLVFNDEQTIMGVDGTGYRRDEDMIYITRDIFPDKSKQPLHARDLLSVRCMLAIEYYGRRKFCKKAPQVTMTWKDEVAIIVDTARFAPSLTDYERSIAYQYAGTVADEHGYALIRDAYGNSLFYDDVTIQPEDTPITLKKLQEIYDVVEEAKRDIYGNKPVDDEEVLAVAEKLMDEFDESFKELAK